VGTSDPSKLLLDCFPGLGDCEWKISSPSTVKYNCIGWAMHDQGRNWWPVFYYWPRGAIREETVEACRQAFVICGFEVCDSAGMELGFEKVAIYAQGSELTHAARQLPNGCWTSKIGELEDIEHETLEALESTEYGQVVLIMRRPTS
jgi:hypothetical protein